MKDEAAREARLRRQAIRQGLMLQKSRRRDPQQVDFGRFWLIEPYLNALVAGDHYGLSLDEVEDWLAGD